MSGAATTTADLIATGDVTSKIKQFGPSSSSKHASSHDASKKHRHSSHAVNVVADVAATMATIAAASAALVQQAIDQQQKQAQTESGATPTSSKEANVNGADGGELSSPSTSSAKSSSSSKGHHRSGGDKREHHHRHHHRKESMDGGKKTAAQGGDKGGAGEPGDASREVGDEARGGKLVTSSNSFGGADAEADADAKGSGSGSGDDSKVTPSAVGASGAPDRPQLTSSTTSLSSTGSSSSVTTTTTSSGKSQTLIVSEDSSGAVHTYSLEEQAGIVAHLNAVLSSDVDLTNSTLPFAHLPIKLDTDDIFECVRDGVLLGKFINTFTPEDPTVKRLVVKPGMNQIHMIENCNRVLKAARVFCHMESAISPADLAAGKPKYLILAFLWQLVAYDLRRMVKVTLENRDWGILVEDQDTQDQVVTALHEEEILLRWFNHHLTKAGHPNKITNFTSDIMDSVKYVILLNQLEPAKCSLKPLDERDTKQRASLCLAEADKIGCRLFINESAILEGVENLNFAFVANLFSKYPSMEIIKPKVVEPEPAPVEPIPTPKDPEPEPIKPDLTPVPPPEAPQPILEPVLPPPRVYTEKLIKTTKERDDLDFKLKVEERKAEVELKRKEENITHLENKIVRQQDTFQREKEKYQQQLALAQAEKEKRDAVKHLSNQELQTRSAETQVENRRLRDQQAEISHAKDTTYADIRRAKTEQLQLEDNIRHIESKMTKEQRHFNRMENRIEAELSQVDLPGLEDKLKNTTEEVHVLTEIKSDLKERQTEASNLLVMHKRETTAVKKSIEEMLSQLTSMNDEDSKLRDEARRISTKTKVLDVDTNRREQHIDELSFQTRLVQNEIHSLEITHEEKMELREHLQSQIAVETNRKVVLEGEVEAKTDELIDAIHDHEFEVQNTKQKAAIELQLQLARQEQELRVIQTATAQVNAEHVEIATAAATAQLDARTTQIEANALTIETVERRKEFLEAKRKKEEQMNLLKEAQSEMEHASTEKQELTEKQRQLEQEAANAQRDLRRAMLDNEEADRERANAEYTLQAKQREREIAVAQANAVENAVAGLKTLTSNLANEKDSVIAEKEDREVEASAVVSATEATTKASIDAQMRHQNQQKARVVAAKNAAVADVKDAEDRLNNTKALADAEVAKRDAAANEAARSQSKLTAVGEEVSRANDHKRLLEQTLKNAERLVAAKTSKKKTETEEQKRLRKHAKRAERVADQAQDSARAAEEASRKEKGLQEQIERREQEANDLVEKAKLEAEKIRQQALIDKTVAKERRAKERAALRKQKEAEEQSQAHKVQSTVDSAVTLESRRTEAKARELSSVELQLERIRKENEALRKQRDALNSTTTSIATPPTTDTSISSGL
ncbi:actin binding protein [Pelomyxa schiedti]|nr:actin binding protein [Pelomyxa schiedti]